MHQQSGPGEDECLVGGRGTGGPWDLDQPWGKENLHENGTTELNLERCGGVLFVHLFFIFFKIF